MTIFAACNRSKTSDDNSEAPNPDIAIEDIDTPISELRTSPPSFTEAIEQFDKNKNEENNIDEQTPLDTPAIPTNEDSPSIGESTEDNSETFEIKEVTETKGPISVQNSSRLNMEFLPYNFSKLLYPDDYKIGSLYNPIEAPLEQQSVAEIVIKFLASIEKKELKSDYILSSALVTIRALIAEILNGNIILSSYRIGVITMEEDSARVNIRLWSPVSTVEGEVYLSKSNNNWYIDDIQADIGQLLIEIQEQDKEFIPTSYDIQ